MDTIATAVAKVSQVFQEIPTMRLATDDVRRMTGLDIEACETVLHVLSDVRYLVQARDGTFGLMNERHT